MTMQSSSTDDVMEVGNGRRLALAPQGLLVEARVPSGWAPARAVDYDEILAVYSFETRDWNAAAVGALLAGGLAGVVFLGGWLARLPGIVTGIAALVVGLAVAGLGVYRTATRPRRLLRIEAYGGALLVPNRTPDFFGRLAERLPKTPVPPPVPAPAPFEPGPQAPDY
jgi:hypothetical protein